MVFNKELSVEFMYYFLTARKITTYIIILSCLMFYSYGKSNDVWNKQNEHEKSRTVQGVVVHKEKAICDGSTCHLIIGKVDIDVYGTVDTYRTEDVVHPEEFDKYDVGGSFTYSYTLEKYSRFEHEGYTVLAIIWYIASFVIFAFMAVSKLDDM